MMAFNSNIGLTTPTNSVYYPVRRHMAIKNPVSYDFLSTFVDSIDVFN